MTLLDRLLAKVPRHIVWTPLIMLGSIALLCYAVLYAGFWYQNKFGELGPYRLGGFNYTSRPVASFSVNGQWGGNIWQKEEGGGGGGFVCCFMLPRDAKTVTVRWSWSRTREQVDQDAPRETHETVVALPPITNERDGILSVHFFANNTVRLSFEGQTLPKRLPDHEVPQ